jgi:large subunit ribosomal protein L3
MGRKKWSSPRRGSLAYSPRARAKSWIARVKHWPEVSGEPRPLAMAGYKAGMTHVVVVDDKKGSLTYGKEIVVPATVIETPPMIVCAVRGYVESPRGLTVAGEAWMNRPPKDLARVFTLPETFDPEPGFKKLEDKVGELKEVRLILATQPRVTAKGRKKPELLEVKVGGGDVKSQLEYAKGMLGKEVKASNVFQEGQFVDVLAVTKGKGFQGPVKRFGVARLHHKARKKVRGVGSLGPWHPHYVMRTVPRAGQMGFHRRTEYNKQILKVGGNGVEVTPKGGFIRYGQVRSEYVLVKGSVPGPSKRLITLRYAVRAPEPVSPRYKIEAVSLDSKQGV